MRSNRNGLLALTIIMLAGCDSGPPRQQRSATPPVARGTPAAPTRPLAIPAPANPPGNPAAEADDRTSLIPPPPPRSLASSLSPTQAPTEEPGIKLTKSTGDSAAEAPSQIKNAAVAAAPVEEDSLAQLRRIYESARAANIKLASFEARLTRRETLNGRPGPQEVIAYKFRQQPFSVRLKWIGSEGQGREVVYVYGQYGGKMHIMPSKQDSILPPMRMAFLPDDPMVRSKTRHDIREAGFGESVRQFGNILEMIARNPAERKRLRYLGLVTRPEYAVRLEAVEEIIPARAEPLFPQGGKRVYFFDTGAESVSKGLPVIVIAFDSSTQREVEYYCFDNFLYPIRLTDADFDPEMVFKKK